MVENEARATTIVASKLEGSNLVNENSMADHLMPESCLMSIEQKLCKVNIVSARLALKTNLSNLTQQS